MEMSREILFRAKQVDNGEWVEGYYAIKGKDTDLEEHFIVSSTLDIYTNAYPFYFTDILIKPETVCQYTGLKDKFGKRVFEGDILQLEDRLVKVIWLDANAQFDSVFIRFNRDFKNTSFKGIEPRCYKSYEVVGNIFDNPKLLKEDGIE